MKTKKLSAKLIFNKETVASLENREMNSALGGATALSVCNCMKTIKVGCIFYKSDEYVSCLDYASCFC